MSGNIHDTNVTKLKDEVNNLLTELDEIIANGDSILNYESTLKHKYKYISQTSDNLWKLIIKQYTTSNFDKTNFLKNLEMMLSAISNIQESKITQHDASQNIGETLASQFIPQLKK
jgi:K+/H+ antiporter YhaU regulatory subunit KhtT